MTLLETMVTAAVLILGIGVVASTVVSIVRLNRRNLAQAQAYTIAEWYLERITRLGCGNDPSCTNLKNLDDSTDRYYWNASGIPTRTLPTGTKEPPRAYEIAVDVDPPTEGAEGGIPKLGRTLGDTSLPKKSINLGRVVNVRVTVSWRDELSRNDYNAVALQTRVSP